ncbi:MAG: LAGLIDADG family homing endonuclease [bacterium]
MKTVDYYCFHCPHITEWSITICDIVFSMARRWTKEEENKCRRELIHLYVQKNKALKEVADILGIAEQTVFSRMKRLNIKTQPSLKENYLNKRGDVKIPKKYSKELAELFGVMLGDGHISHFQVIVNLGTKEASYAHYVCVLIKKIFKVNAKISVRNTGYRDVYVGSTVITSWLLSENLANNKVKSQVDVPKWIFEKPEFMRRFLRGFFDTDGSVYRLRFGIQISLTNYSKPLLLSLQRMLFKLGYSPSAVSADKVYLTKISDIKRFFKEISPKNLKHQERYKKFVLKLRRSYSSNYSRL